MPRWWFCQCISLVACRTRPTDSGWLECLLDFSTGRVRSKTSVRFIPIVLGVSWTTGTVFLTSARR